MGISYLEYIGIHRKQKILADKIALNDEFMILFDASRNTCLMLRHAPYFKKLKFLEAAIVECY